MGVVRKALKAMFPRDKWHILRGDNVTILAGKDKGQQGVVTKVIRDSKQPRVVVEGLNLAKRHIKRTEDNPGGIITVEVPIHFSNVALIDPVTSAAVRTTWRYLEDGTKVRVTRGKQASGSVIPRPEVLMQRRKPRPLPGGKDTPIAEVLRPTYVPGELPTSARFLQGVLPRKAPTVVAAALPPPAARGLITAAHAQPLMVQHSSVSGGSAPAARRGLRTLCAGFAAHYA